MKNMLLIVFYVAIDGVFGESVSVMEGDSVTLHTSLPEIQRHDVLQWRFGAKGALIAQINKGANKSSVYDDVPDGRFRDRLKLDNQTGDLTITNTRTEHSGHYEVTSTRNKIFTVTVLPVDAVKSVSVLVGDSVSLNTDLTEIQRDDVIRWRFEHLNPPIAEINRKDRKISKHDGSERFRGRLQLDYWTGSLTIRNITTKHSGFYEVDISISNRHTIHKSFSVTVRGEVRTVSVMKGESVLLHTGLTEIQRDDFITWMFEDIILAEIYKNQSSLDQLFYTYDGADERFRDGLELNKQTGSLNITQCKTSGVYELKINRRAIYQRFTVTVSVAGLSSGEIVGIAVVVLLVFAVVAVVIYRRLKISKLKSITHSGEYKLQISGSGKNTFERFSVSVSDEIRPVLVMEGESVPLDNDTIIQTDDEILWMFGDKDIVIAESKGGTRGTTTDHGPDGRFRGRLKLDHQTGSLTITNIRTEDSGPYKLQISRGGQKSFKLFNVSVSGPTALGSIPEEEHLFQSVRYWRQRSITTES
ncbi:unnamed protein product [Leuciscus chuanchicus]